LIHEHDDNGPETQPGDSTRWLRQPIDVDKVLWSSRRSLVGDQVLTADERNIEIPDPYLGSPLPSHLEVDPSMAVKMSMR
jgi:hypothetical protein